MINASRNKLHRSSSLAAPLVLCALLGGLHAVVCAETVDSRPNVLSVAVDDMNDWVGFLGGYPGKVHTPNIDRLAGTGTALTNAHTATPVCCPSRAAVMSGLLPTSSGVYSNQQWWEPHRPDLITLPIHFRRHGYTAAHTEQSKGSDHSGTRWFDRRVCETHDSGLEERHFHEQYIHGSVGHRDKETVRPQAVSYSSTHALSDVPRSGGSVARDIR
jgi:arylsulfatase A-like enzyme